MIVADLNSQQLVAQLWGIQAAGMQLIMIVIDVLVCMEMVIDGGMVMVIDDDIHDDCHVIVIAICIFHDHVIYNCHGYDNRVMIDRRDL